MAKETGNQQLEVGGGLRFGGAGGNPGNPPESNGFAIFSLGGRYFTSDADTSPYLGGGLTWSYLSLWLPGEGFSGNGSGLGGYIDAGVQILRTHKTHLAFGARLDLPCFNLTNSNSYLGAGTPAPAPTNVYYAPLSFELRITL